MKKLTLIFILLAFLTSVLLAQNPVTNTVQTGSAKAKEVLLVFEVELKGLTPKPIKEAVLTDAIVAELAEAGTYDLVDRDPQYYYFKQIQEKSKKPCAGEECLTDLAANLDADLFIKAEVSKAENECRFTAQLFKRKPQTVLYFADQSKIESCSCKAGGLEKAAHILGKKLTGRGEASKEIPAPAPASSIKGGEMILVPAGEFMMGCDEAVVNSCFINEKPDRAVYLDAYYIDKYEVTVSEFEKCVIAGKCEAPVSKNEMWPCNRAYPDRGNHPINCVVWSQAQAYCEWAGKRLPTEAEWEKAARGTDGRIYPWGNQEASCNYAVMSIEEDYGCDRYSTWPVGSKPAGASPYGVMDMAGNVSEWISDWYDWNYYKYSPTQNPSGPSTGEVRSLRGAAWYYIEPYANHALRVSFRYWSDPSEWSGLIGFRCARDAK
ncbi:MAG: formylglycine-generating enzyme family protein [bacterium]|nr:formylglycine-generating enzyme family protein [bacterium]